MKNNNYKIEYLTSFNEELYEIVYYITHKLKNKNASEILLRKINNNIITRSKMPTIYETYKSKNNRKYIWYRIHVDNYTIFYTVRKNIMEVAHIIYGRRNIDDLI